MNILSLDTKYRYLYFNDTHIEAMLNTYNTKPELGVCIFDLITVEKDIAEVKGYYDKALSGKAHISVRTSGTGGNLAFYETFYNPIYNEQHEIMGVSIFAQDITERKLAEDHIRESDSMRELLLDIITHDLINPAGVIFGLSKILLSEFPDNPIAGTIHTSSERLVKVLSDTTLLSQATFGEQIPKDPMSLLELVEEVSGDFSAEIKAAGMELNMRGVVDVEINANPLIGEVIKNYISNAIKYAAEGKLIQIESIIEGDTILILVKDFGVTIDEADRETIFIRRAQLEGSEKRGRGIGLAIVKRIAEVHGGTGWVEPNLPSGNSFCLRIPI